MVRRRCGLGVTSPKPFGLVSAAGIPADGDTLVLVGVLLHDARWRAHVASRCNCESPGGE